MLAHNKQNIILADNTDDETTNSQDKKDIEQSTTQSNTIFTQTQTNTDNINTAVLNKIVTSTTGFDLPLKDEAKNIIIIDKKDIQDKGYTNLEQALSQQPFITFVAGQYGTKELDLRGQGGDASRAVKILINRVPINLQDPGSGSSSGGHGANSVTPFNQINIDEVESIEIIPGGGAVVYGNGTRGGVINIVTKKPNKDYARFSLKGGSYESKDTWSAGAGASGGKAIGNHVFISANANYNYQSGLRAKEYTQNVYAGFQAIYQINENHKLDFNTSYSRMWKNFMGYYSKRNADGSFKSIEQMKAERYLVPSTLTGNGEVTQDFVQASLNYTGKLSEKWRFDTIAFYQYSNFLFPEISRDTSNFTNHAVGLNLKGKYQGEKNMVMVGIDNLFEASDKLAKSAYNNVQNKGTKYSFSLYALDSYKFNDFFSLSGGARGEISHFDVKGHTGISFGSLSGYFEVDAKKTQFGYAAELTPSFNYSDTGSVYIKGELGFISPSVRQAISSDPNYTGTGSTGVAPKIASDIKPEQYFTGEIGWRDEFEYSYLSATLFYTHTLNEIRYLLNGFETNYYNLGQTQRVGFEFSAKQNLFTILSLQESLSYIYSNVLKGRNAQTGGTSTSQNEEGMPIPYVPMLKATIAINVEAYKAGNHSLNVWWNNSYYGEQHDNLHYIINENGYVLSDLGLSYRYKDFNLNVGVKNLFDSFYVAYQSSSSSTTSGQSTNYLPGEGRSYYLEMKYSF